MNEISGAVAMEMAAEDRAYEHERARRAETLQAERDTLADYAKGFGSYLENYGRHHGWCATRPQSSALPSDCTCGFADALRSVAWFHRRAADAISERRST